MVWAEKHAVIVCPAARSWSIGQERFRPEIVGSGVIVGEPSENEIVVEPGTYAHPVGRVAERSTLKTVFVDAVTVMQSWEVPPVCGRAEVPGVSVMFSAGSNQNSGRTVYPWSQSGSPSRGENSVSSCPKAITNFPVARIRAPAQSGCGLGAIGDGPVKLV